jgi:hypothetical protein
MRTYNGMVAFCEAEHRNPSYNVRRGGMCQWFSRSAVGAYAFGGTAHAAWLSIPVKHRFTGKPLPGSIAYWSGGSKGYGHATPVVEDGHIWSTDILHWGRVDKVDYRLIAQKWGLHYLGWIDWCPSGDLPVLHQPKPLPVVHVSRVQPGEHNNEVRRVQRALHAEPAIQLDYSTGPGHFGPRTKKAYKAWQRHLGFAQDDADGHPGHTSLRRLGKRHGFQVSS